MAQQIKLESNIPLIFITIMLIGISVYMIFEIRKINQRINKIISVINENDISGNKEIVDNKVNNHTSIDGDDNINMDIQKDNEESTDRVEQWRNDTSNIKQSIINEINRQGGLEEDNEEEQREQREQEEQEEYINNNVFSSFLMTQNMMGNNESKIDIEEIQEGYTSGENDNRGPEEDDDRESVEGGDSESVEGYDRDSEEDDKKSEIEDDESKSEEDSSDEEIINLKEITTKDDFESEKIIVDDTFSVNQLKQLCKNMGLSVSGNKTTLINRIMENQK